MKTNWTPLREELRVWRREKLTLPFWWRDDDAITRTAALETLVEQAVRMELPVHIAVIPALADASLAQAVREHRLLVPLVHGWAHENKSPEGQKKAEFGHPRADAPEELERGIHRLIKLFGADLVPLFVPPWNRFDADLARLLPGFGYRGLSTYLARPARYAHPGLIQINTHIDPVDWRGTRSLADPELLIMQVVTQLRARRKGEQDPTEPFGLLTHHLVHTPDVWKFSEALIYEMLHGAAVPQPVRPHLEF